MCVWVCVWVCVLALCVSSDTGSQTPPDLLMKASQGATARLRLRLRLHLCNRSHVSLDFFGDDEGRKDDECQCEGGPSVFRAASW